MSSNDDTESIKQTLKLVFNGIINTCPILLPVFAITEALLFNDSRGGVIFSGSLLNILINVILRKFVKNTTTPNPLCFMYEKINIGGMPSLHTQTIGFLVGFIFTMMHIKSNFRLLTTIFCVLLTIIISIQRYNCGCDTIMDIFIGLLLGILLGSLWAWIVAPTYTPWGSESDVDFGKFDKRKCDKDKDEQDYECKAYKNGRIIESSN